MRTGTRKFEGENSGRVCQLVVESPPQSHPWGSPKRAPPSCPSGSFEVPHVGRIIWVIGVPVFHSMTGRGA